jgi:hypothetical protein
MPVRSARGEVVNFELIAIKQQLASVPTPVGVDDRRRFIDEKDGIRTKQIIEQPAEIVDALSIGIEAAETSAAVAEKASKKSK